MTYVPKTSFHKDWAARDREDMTLPFILGTQAILIQIIQNRTLWVKVCFAYIFFFFVNLVQQRQVSIIQKAAVL